jgi:hypothetical protein
MVDRTPNRQQTTGQHQNTIRVLVLPVFCCLYGVLSTIISPFFPGHRVFVLPSLLLSIWCSYRQQKTVQHQNTMTRKEGGNNGGENTI